MLIHLDYKIDKQTLLREYEELKDELYEFNKNDPHWKKMNIVGEYGERCRKKLTSGLKGRNLAGYYLQPAETSVSPHTDSKCKCRVNLRLTDDDGVITIGGEVKKYDFALINTGRYEHSVSKCSRPRLLFSIIYHDDSFEEVRNRLQEMSIC